MKTLVVIGMVFMFYLNIYSQYCFDNNTKTFLEEKFTYDVSWLFIHIGTITITTESIEQRPDLKKIIVDIKTASGLPFIDIDEYNVVIMRLSDGMTMYYDVIEKQDGKKVEAKCNFYEKENLAVYEVKDFYNKTLIRKDTLRYNKPYLVGSSLIYYTRLILNPGSVKSVPTMLGGNFYKTILNYCGPVEFIEIDAFESPIRTFKYEGNAEWDGKATAGLSGEFTGWISDDDASVVISAEMKIFLGSIDIELQKWYKPGWKPPTNKSRLFTDKGK